MSDKTSPDFGGDDDAQIAAALAAALDHEDGIETDEIEVSDDGDDEDAPSERVRDERGRFAKSEQGDEGEQAAPSEKAAVEPPKATEGQHQAEQPVAQDQATAGPPTNLSIQTKANWATLPDYAKADFVRREEQMHAGMRRYEGCASVAEEAERNGTTLGQYVTRVRAVDKMLSQDFMGGIDAICRQYGVNPTSLAQAFSVRYGGSFENPNQSTQQAQPAAIDPSAIAQQVRAQLRSEMQMDDLNSVIARFAADPRHPFYNNVEDRMAALVPQIKSANPQMSRDEVLEQAYEQACWAHPEIRTVLLNQQAATPAKQIQAKAAAASQARAASKSITGAPSPGAQPRGTPQSSIEDDVRAAFEASEGRI